MTTVPRRRAARAALALGFLYIAASARSQVVVNSVMSVTNGSNPGQYYEFQNGTLKDTSGNTYANAVQIDPNYNGTIDANANSSIWSGVISGTGNSLTLTDSSGGGKIELDAANTYTGVTTINGTNLTVQVANASAFGTGSVSLTASTLQMQTAGTVANNIQLNGSSNFLDIDGNAATFSGSLFGTGSITLENSGVAAELDLTGSSYYSGDTTVNSGMTIGLAKSGFGDGPVSLNDDTLKMVGAASLPNSFSFTNGMTVNANGNTATFSGTISGSGASGLTFEDTGSGNGTVTLSGSGSSWTGGTAINSGSVALGAVNGLSPDSTLTVATNGTFDMSGFNQQISGANSVTDNGTIKTGAATLTVGGNYTASAASFLYVLPTFGISNLTVAGTTTLGGQTLSIEKHPASGYYQIVGAQNTLGPSVADDFTFATGDLPTGYTGALSYVGDDVYLTLTAPSLVLAGQSRNEASIAAGLNNASGSSSSDMAAVLSQLNTDAVASPSPLNGELDQLSPIAYQALSGLSTAGTGAQMEAVNRRVANLQAGRTDASANAEDYAVGGSPYPGTLIAEGGSVPVPPAQPKVNPLDNPWGIYASGLYATGRLDGVNGASGFQPGYGFSSYGGMMGADYRFSDSFAAGLTVGYVGGLADLDGVGGQASDDSLLFGAYGTYWDDAFHGSLYLGTSLDSFETSRNIPAFGRTATAKPDGDDLKLDASGGWDLNEGLATLSPFFGLSYDRQSIAAFSEGGAGALDLNVNSMSYNSLRSSFGTKVSRKFTADWFSITPSLSAGWEHEFADQSRAISADFSSAGGAFSVNTADVSRDALLAGVALTMDMTSSVSLRLGYSGDFRTDFEARTADFSLRVRF